MVDFGFVRRPCLHRGVQPLKAYGGLVGSLPKVYSRFEFYVQKFLILELCPIFVGSLFSTNIWDHHNCVNGQYREANTKRLINNFVPLCHLFCGRIQKNDIWYVILPNREWKIGPISRGQFSFIARNVLGLDMSRLFLGPDLSWHVLGLDLSLGQTCLDLS